MPGVRGLFLFRAPLVVAVGATMTAAELELASEEERD